MDFRETLEQVEEVSEIVKIIENVDDTMKQTRELLAISSKEAPIVLSACGIKLFIKGIPSLSETDILEWIEWNLENEKHKLLEEFSKIMHP